MKDTTISKKSLKIDDPTEVTVPTSRSNAGPTPGPWSDLAGGWIHSPSGTVADANPDGARHRPLDERRANTRLIAAAPALAEALRECLEIVEGLDGWQNDHRKDVGAKARSVLAQALGE